MSHHVVLPLLVLLLLACGEGPDGGAPIFQTRDSAGITIASNAGPDRSLAATEFLRIGGMSDDPRYQFDRIRAIAVDSAGSLWVVDGHESIRQYSAAGELLGEVGRRGEGPGEGPGWSDVILGPGTVAGLSYMPRIEHFRPDGSHIESHLPFTSDRRYVSPLGYGAGSWFSLIYPSYDERSKESWRPRVVLSRSPFLGRPGDTLGLFPARSLISGTRSSWFTGTPSYALDRRGRFWAADTLRYSVAAYGPDGRAVMIVGRRAEPTDYQMEWENEVEAELRAWEDRRFGPLDEQGVRRMMDQIIPDRPPPHLPFIENLLVGPAGWLWVERGDRHPQPAVRAVAHAFGFIRHAWPDEWVAPRVLDVFRPSGEHFGTVRFDGRFEPMAVAADQVYGVAYDELGVESVVSYRVEPAAEQPVGGGS